MTAPFSTDRDAALALLSSGTTLTRKASSFLGQVAVDPTPLSDAQTKWLVQLLDRAWLPTVAAGGVA